MRLHTLAGVPRSGSTLLGNVLAQHPDVSVTGTSALALAIDAVATVMANTPEVQADLANVPGAQEHRYAAAMRGLIEGWHSGAETETVIDKGRGWAMHRLLLDALYPGSVTIMMVRDPRDVVASIEKQHRRSAVFKSPIAPTLYDMADQAMSSQGLVGGPVIMAEDLIRRNLPSVEWVRYETFVRDPLSVMRKLEARLGLDEFEWDTENVENVATDLDALYLGKYPHDGSGPIKATGTTWTEYLPEDLGALIAGIAPLYMHTFGYDTKT